MRGARNSRTAGRSADGLFPGLDPMSVVTTVFPAAFDNPGYSPYRYGPVPLRMAVRDT